MHQRHPHIALAQIAKGAARGHDHAGLLHQFHRKSCAVRIAFRQGSPHKHSTLAVRHVPSDGAKTAAESLISPLILGALLLYGILRTGQGCHRRHLNRQEDTVVDLGAYFGKFPNNLTITYREGHAHAGHIVALGQGVKLDAHLLRARIGQKGLSFPSIVNDIGISIIMQNDNVVLFRERNQLFIKSVIRYGADRIGRVRYDHKLRCPRSLRRNILESRQEIIFRIERISLDLRTRQLRSQGKYRITRIRSQHDIARIAQGHRHMSHTLLGAVQCHNLICLQAHTKPGLIEILHGFDKLRPVRNGVFIIFRILAGLHHGVHHMLRRLKIRRTDGEIIDLHTFLCQFVLFMGQGCEDTFLYRLCPF